MVTNAWAESHYRPELPKLGDHVETTGTHKYRGRVTQIHHFCPESDAWLACQTDTSVRTRKDDPWASILVHQGGAVVIPFEYVKVVEPFDFDNEYGLFYFRDMSEKVYADA